MRKIVYLFAGVLILTPVIITVFNLFSGTIAFWFDPARDLYSGIANLKKVTLIGPTSGIPGLFYGPYWIWLLSIGLLISHDPRIVAFIALTLPYLTLMPLGLYFLSKTYGKIPVILAWALFMLSSGGYSIQLWNPHLAPLFLFLLITVLILLPTLLSSRRDVALVLLAGVLSGLVIQFHISLGIGVAAGVFLYLLLRFIMHSLEKRKKIKMYATQYILTNLLVLTGVIGTALPFFVFEIRHDFMQIKTITATLTSPFAVVGMVGLTDGEIIQKFFASFARLMQAPLVYTLVALGIALIIFAVSVVQKSDKMSEPDRNIILAVASCSFTILMLYTTSKNPVWDYHFIGIEVFFLFLLILLTHKLRILMVIVCIWTGFLIMTNSIAFYHQVSSDRLGLSSLATKEYIVDAIYSDAQGKEFAVEAYNPAIHTYDYDYLFEWMGRKENRRLPIERHNAQTVYLIIPKVEQAIFEDFIHYKTPDTAYKTVQRWMMPDNTTILKREKVL